MNNGLSQPNNSSGVKVLTDATPRKVLIMLATSPITINSEVPVDVILPTMTQLSLYEVATRLRRYITQPLPLLASNATFVLMNIAEWQRDDPQGTLTVGGFYNLSKYNADVVLPFNGISSAVAEHLTTIIYKE
ncbi:hypothetical protein [Weissella cibaria]|uniref:hypothetical protein n=1 Tax=Weissella cibaria TaxID=137591 RepID=UPI000706125A|nr:hypothetical protein [Weissella cibaria]ALI33926.1 hypothetical protein AO080_10950 [Weissella cibaria]